MRIPLDGKIDQVVDRPLAVLGAQLAQALVAAHDLGDLDVHQLWSEQADSRSKIRVSEVEPARVARSTSTATEASTTINPHPYPRVPRE